MFNIDLPSGKKISVEAPTFSDRMEAVKEFRATKDAAGYSVEELMAAKALVAIDGNTVTMNMTMDPIFLFSNWSNSDVQYYIELFMTMFFIDDKLRERATTEAKKLMTGQQAKTESKK